MLLLVFSCQWLVASKTLEYQPLITSHSLLLSFRPKIRRSYGPAGPLLQRCRRLTGGPRQDHCRSPVGARIPILLPASSAGPAPFPLKSLHATPALDG